MFMGKLAEQFIAHFSYNIDNPMTLMDMSTTKQKEGEYFASFLQRWHSLARRSPCHIMQKEQVDMFIENLVPQIKYALQMQCINSFHKVTEKGIKFKKGLIE